MRSFLFLLLLTGACRGTVDKDDTDPVEVPVETDDLPDTDPTVGDSDGDGANDDDDCYPLDPARFPGAEERCNGLDDDCDTEVDEEAVNPATWLADADGDTYGDPVVTLLACAAPDAGWVATGGDCDDLDALIHPGAAEVCDGVDQDCDLTADEDAIDALLWYADGDGDTFGDPLLTALACSPPAGFVGDDTDCDDANAEVRPTATELCNGVDDDCDTQVDEGAEDAPPWFRDGDGDGFGDPAVFVLDCEAQLGFVANNFDCEDGDDDVNPDAPELCNGIDDDCDLQEDEEGALDAPTWYDDVDRDGFGDEATATASCEAPFGAVDVGGDCDDDVRSVNPLAPELCDGLDNDCDTEIDEEALIEGTWYADGDEDGFGDEADTVLGCSAPEGYTAAAGDCAPDDATVFPGADEDCVAIDRDCDGDPIGGAIDTMVFFLDADGDGVAGALAQQQACAAPTGWYPEALDCNDLSPVSYPGAEEVCDALDNDCDLFVDEDATGTVTWYRDVDGDSYGDPADSVDACARPFGYVVRAGDCDDDAAAARPNGVEVCDGLDNDCLGGADGADALDALSWYADLDDDGFGDPASAVRACDAPTDHVSRAGDCEDGDDRISPAAEEWCNGLDDDCSGEVDDGPPVDASTWYADRDGDGSGDPSRSLVACEAPDAYVANGEDCDDTEILSFPGAEEFCDGEDNDCDTFIDEDATDPGTWFLDDDDDGYGLDDTTLVICTPPAGYADRGGDCDDTSPAVRPGAVERCDGLDNDCDTEVDGPAALGASTWYLDADEDLYGDSGSAQVACTAPGDHVALPGDCDDGEPAVNPGGIEVCDLLDNDCSGVADDGSPIDAPTWYLDLDGDGRGRAATAIAMCQPLPGLVSLAGDCDDTDETVYFGADEVCDGDDDDCDGVIDEGAIDAQVWYVDADGDQVGRTSGPVIACTAPAGHVATSGDCDDADITAFPGADEVCDGDDEDCDGVADDGAVDATTWFLDVDGDGVGGAAFSRRACAAPPGHVASSDDCNDLDAGAWPGHEETCDGTDDDCDTFIDEADAVDRLTWFDDADGDDYGDAATAQLACEAPAGTVADDTDCDDAEPTVYPGAREVYDNLDNDCDGNADDDLWVGSGSDGPITVVDWVDLSTTPSNDRVRPDAETWPVAGIEGDEITTATLIDPDSLAPGDEVLIINLQGTDAAHDAVGTWAFASVAWTDDTTIGLAMPLVEVFGQTSNADLTGQAIVVQRVPHYTDVTVLDSGTLTTSAWDGQQGGVLAFRANGVVSVASGGTITMSEAGFAGGSTGTCNNCDAFQGESYAGLGVGNRPSGVYNEDIFGYLANEGGGGANVTGGGGNHAGGATAGMSWNGGGYTAPSAGQVYGVATLDAIFFGSGGGGVWNGGTDAPGENPGPGGGGGGVVYIGAGEIQAPFAGAITADGGTTFRWAQGTWTYGAGGGAGGTIYLLADQITLGANAVSAVGGLGETTHLRDGGHGGVGRVRVDCNTCGGAAIGSPAAATALATGCAPDPGYGVGPE